MKQAENSLKCKALLMKIMKTASFGSIWISSDVINTCSSTFGFKTRRCSYFPLETGANCQTSALKRIKKIDFAFYCLYFRKNDQSGSF